GRQWNLLLAGDELQRAQEAGRVAGGEQLLRVGAFAARAAQLARGGQGEVELAVGGGGAAFAAAGGGGGAGVEDLLEGHGGLLWGLSGAVRPARPTVPIVRHGGLPWRPENLIASPAAWRSPGGRGQSLYAAHSPATTDHGRRPGTGDPDEDATGRAGPRPACHGRAVRLSRGASGRCGAGQPRADRGSPRA